MVDRSAARRIAALALEDVFGDASPLRIVEIGPGTGQLTEALLDMHADVSAIEIDADMVRILQSQEALRTAHIVEADALTFDYGAFGAGSRWRMTGNLPYVIATPLLMRLVEMTDGPAVLTIMIQKDVADRLAARAGTRAYGSLSIAVQYRMRIERAFTLGPGAFYPRPKVDSTVVRLIRRDKPAVDVADERWFLQVARAAFAYRRKTLANSLSLALGLDRAAVAQALSLLGFDTEIRGEQLDLAGFARLAGTLSR